MDLNNFFSLNGPQLLPAQRATFQVIYFLLTASEVSQIAIFKKVTFLKKRNCAPGQSTDSTAPN